MYISVWQFNSYMVRIKQNEEKFMRPEKNMMTTHTHAQRQFDSYMVRIKQPENLINYTHTRRKVIRFLHGKNQIDS